ncbi:hypothetical protein O6H91_03G043700 [Diphasiastrum complanatum]|uniref:Uncharacterized protein n=5 Tax=Diphasiastrum complanatum TaxID=34168 RepID=A0ACC2E5N2_DIPCM|nr:hypothetical protein O6H91_03G043700 [Diphasiastrum complanatum]KAJ7561842.1 hypothetical protein O6H91_03G043700 [Diphasiastrum complanatum]KAJ7561843.1 hypothetical protein O6H91_03G043700 [Diphasiastrum complanatum]KAJ7561844.1 hypothetical protein O6H91_03G043700 [Diphasiastrum complanatum]KAJ7561845.1 hypothetical protein O6H91_03G043700 [Diphasiastrum complanatum]
MGKRKRLEEEDGHKPLAGDILPSQIKNKQKRSEASAKVKLEKKKAKKQRIESRNKAEKQAFELGEIPLPRKIPRTIENTREVDETIAQPDDDELHADDGADEFSAHFRREHTPKLLITACQKCFSRTRKFIRELLNIIPNAHYYKRGSYTLKQIVKYAKNREFTSLIVVHENQREPNDLLIVSLPEGPTAHFRLSNLVLSKEIKNHGRATRHLPELILNNFTTRLGHRIGRLLASIFPQDPNFHGRRAVTFHNQRDFIFFRHHRYIFESKELKEQSSKPLSKTDAVAPKKKLTAAKQAVIARLQECGPRFTLKLTSLQNGTFNSKYGEYEWIHKPDMDTSRRRFFL